MKRQRTSAARDSRQISLARKDASARACMLRLTRLTHCRRACIGIGDTGKHNLFLVCFIVGWCQRKPRLNLDAQVKDLSTVALSLGSLCNTTGCQTTLWKPDFFCGDSRILVHDIVVHTWHMFCSRCRIQVLLDDHSPFCRGRAFLPTELGCRPAVPPHRLLCPP